MATTRQIGLHYVPCPCPANTTIFQTICNDCNNITLILQFFKKLVVKKEPAHSFLPNLHLKPAFSSPIPLPSSESLSQVSAFQRGGRWRAQNPEPVLTQKAQMQKNPKPAKTLKGNVSRWLWSKSHKGKTSSGHFSEAETPHAGA